MSKSLRYKTGATCLAFAMLCGNFAGNLIPIHAEEVEVQTGLGALLQIPEVNGNQILGKYANGAQLKITFYRNDVFRLNIEKDGNFLDKPAPNSPDHTGEMVAKTEADYQKEYNKIQPKVTQTKNDYVIETKEVELHINKTDSRMSLKNKLTGKVLWSEKEPVLIENGNTKQTLQKGSGEYFYGGGVTNGFVNQNGRNVNIRIGSNWTSGANSSPVPFYLSTNGYGVMRYTWKTGAYNFARAEADTVTTTHGEERFDAFYFVGETMTNIVDEYSELTGKAALIPKYGFNTGHLNCYNRDKWTKKDGVLKEYKEGAGAPEDAIMETLNGVEDKSSLEYEVSARGVLDDYNEQDMPLGFFLPNDGYGCGYGQTDSFEGDLQNLKSFADYAKERGVLTGLWTQENIWPADIEHPKKGERDIQKEAKAGVTTLKTDVAWVGNGYSMALDGIKKGYEAIEDQVRPLLISLDGWAGTQRYAGLWSGDQTGGNWEYIRMHIPTYITSGLSGQFTVGSDIDGIYGGGNAVINTRDWQWKSFTPLQLDMDGWGSEQKTPWAFGEPYTSINRMYAKLKAEMLPYNYSIAKESTDSSTPMVRPSFMEDGNAYTYSNKASEYQYTWGSNILVAPIYKDTAADAKGNDIRNDIYLPGEDTVWIDYFTGERYHGGNVLNNIDAPIWKTPIFIKNGAIIPMAVENNTATSLKGNEDRIFEVYPSGNTNFTLYDDDGVTQDYKAGEGSTTKITSTAPKEGKGKAVITVQPTRGSYKGMVNEKGTQFTINTTAKPSSLEAHIGNRQIALKEVNTQKEFDEATGNVYYYNAQPDLNKYATDGSDFANIEIITTPKLYVKVEATDITKHAVQVLVNGFDNTNPINDGQTMKPEVPQNLKIDEDKTTDSSLSVAWDKAEHATTYQVKVNDVIYSNIKKTTFTIPNLTPLSEYNITVRAVNSKGTSDWSNSVDSKTTIDEKRNMIKDPLVRASSTTGQWPISNVVDENPETVWRTNYSDGNNLPAYALLDLRMAYQLDKLEYVALADSYKSARAKDIEVQISIDGKHFKTVTNATCEKEERFYTFDLHGARARYVKFVINNSYSYYSGASEISVYKLDGSDGTFVGDYTGDNIVDKNDLTFFKNYLGLDTRDTLWESQLIPADLNENGVLDAFDLAYVSAQLDGGLEQKPSIINGDIAFHADKTEDIKKGDEITVEVKANNFKNIYAFNMQLPYGDDFEVVSDITTTNKNVQKMQSFINNYKKYNYLSIAYTFIGENNALNINDTVATVKLRAKNDVSKLTLTPEKAYVVNCDLDTKDATQVIRLVDNIKGISDQAMEAGHLVNLTDGLLDGGYSYFSNWSDPAIINGDKYVILDLQKTYDITQLDVYAALGYEDSGFKNIYISISSDGTTYEKLLDGVKISVPFTGVDLKKDGKPVNARYIRIDAPDKLNHAQSWISCGDMQVHYVAGGNQ